MAVKKRNFVDPKVFYQQFLDWHKTDEYCVFKQKYDAYREQYALWKTDKTLLKPEYPTPRPTIPDNIARNLMLMSKKYASRSNWHYNHNHHYNEELISEGILALVKACPSFDSTKYNNPFAYLTTTLFNSFLQYTTKENDKQSAVAAQIDQYFNGFAQSCTNSSDGPQILTTESVSMLKQARDEVNGLREKFKKPPKEKQKIKPKKTPLGNMLG